MALEKTKLVWTHSRVLALATLLGCAATCGPALAQVYWGDRGSGGSWGDRSRSGGFWGDRNRSDHWQSPSRDFFPFFGDRAYRPPAAVDYSKAPPPRKPETPPTTTVVVVGDAMADWLGYGLDELYADQPEIGVERKIRATSGLVRYDAKSETLDWPQAIKDALANEKPNAIVVMLGLNDRSPLRDNKSPPVPPNAKRAGELPQASNQSASPAAAQLPQDKTEPSIDSEAPAQATPQGDTQRPVPGGSYEFHTDPWAALYTKRIDAMIAALKSKGVPVVWVGLPAIRGAKSNNDMSYLDELYRERAERAGIVFVDVWDGFVDDQGRYAMRGPDFEGQVRQLRTADGAYFTKAGAVKLASYVDHELKRLMSSYVAPVALPGPEMTPKSGPTDARPDVGPVLPLTASGGEHDLVGAGDRPTSVTSDPIAVKVLSRGDALMAPAGRADDFSWPHQSDDARATPKPDSPQPVALAPSAPATPDMPTKDDGKNQTDTKKEAKEKRASELRVTKTRHAPNGGLDDPPIPPAPVGSR